MALIKMPQFLAHPGRHSPLSYSERFAGADDEGDDALADGRARHSVLQCFAAAPAPSVIFSGALKEVPGTKLVVVSLKLEPAGKAPPHPHHHPGSVYVYVTRGVARLGLKGQPVQIVHAGESFFEAPGSVHTVAESASDKGTGSHPR